MLSQQIFEQTLTLAWQFSSTIQIVGKPLNLISGLSSSKAFGHDHINNKYVKDGADILSPIVCHLVNLVIRNGRYPEVLKKSVLKPLYKGKGDRQEATSYRPLSIISSDRNVLEAVLAEQLDTHMTTTRQWNQNIHAYRKNRSSGTYLVQLTDRINSAKNRKHISGSLILYISAAFDRVRSHILCNNMKLYNVCHHSTDLIHSYLSGRQQAVMIAASLSAWKKTKHGIP